MSEARDGAPGGITRQVTIDALCEHFANDIMSVEEFERRIDAAHAAQSADELKDLLRDLPGGDVPTVFQPGSVPAPESHFTVTSAANVKEKKFVVVVLGGSSRRGRWSPARNNYAISVMGGAELDFSEAGMGPGVTDLKIFTLFGGVEVVAPPGLNVESHGIALMGGFDHSGDNVFTPDPHAPTLRITGLACMGGVTVTVRHPGETAGDARRRRKLERQDQRRITRGED
jgi:hypothetical protein